MYPLRPENIYRFFPEMGRIRLHFDGGALGLSDIDAFDVLET